MNAFKKYLAPRTTSALRPILLGAVACLGLTLSSQAHADQLNALPQNAALLVGQRLVSSNCFYHLEMQPDANLVLYASAGTSDPIWSNHQSGNVGGPSDYPAQDLAFAILQGNGDFVEYVPGAQTEWDDHQIWDSNTQSYVQEILEMQVDGNVVIYPANATVRSGATALWSTNTAGRIPPLPPNDECPMTSSYTELYPGMKVASGTPAVSYEAYTSETWHACGEICVQTAGCTTFQFDPVEPWGGGCLVYTGPVVLAPVFGSTGLMTGTIVSSS